MRPKKSEAKDDQSVGKETPDEARTEDKSPLNKFRTQLQQETVKAYVENIRFVRAPFFGIAFDVNDLGLVGGVAVIIILLLMRYSLSREIKNLNISLREAVDHGKLPAFYHALAMRQVFTVPHMKGEKRNKWLGVAPRIISILPAIVFLLGVSYDYYTTIGPNGLYDIEQVTFQLITETVWLALIFYLSVRCSSDTLSKQLRGAKKIRILKTWFPEDNQLQTVFEEALENRNTRIELLLCDPDYELLHVRSRGANVKSEEGRRRVIDAL